MKRMKCIAVDDIPLALKKIEEYIRCIPDLENCGSFTDGLEGLSYARENDIDLVFLDIQMEQFSGLKFMAAAQGRFCIIITSAYQEYAIEGFEYNVTDYLLKPYSFERFAVAVERARKKINGSSSMNYMFIKSAYRTERVNFEEILYIKSEGAYLKIVTKERSLMTLMNFSSILELLPSTNYLRVHKSYAIAKDKITAFEKNTIFIRDTRIPIGESFRKEIFNLLDHERHSIP